MSHQERIDADTAWLTEHSLEVARDYAGKWIAVYEGRVVGVGSTAVEAANQARLICPDGAFVLEAVEDDADVIYGVF